MSTAAGPATSTVTSPARRLAAELVGTALLLVAIVGSGITASVDGGLDLLAHAVAVGATLTVLIVVLAPVSGAHLNPAVTLAMLHARELSARLAGVYLAAQLAGAVVGVALAHLMFDRQVLAVATVERSGAALVVGEAVASFGLLVVVLALSRSRPSAIPVAVGAWIAGAILFTSSGALANPAVTLARALTDTAVGVAPSSVGGLLVGQAVGTLVAVVLVAWLRPTSATTIEGTTMTDTPTVLFLCVHNAGRSQMAAGWLQHLAGDRVTVLSGGSTPAEQVNPAAIASMREVGIDIADAEPKPWTDETLGVADVIVTMGCGDACPAFPGKRYLDWQLDDPAGKTPEQLRPIRDRIEAHVRQLIDELALAPTPTEHGAAGKAPR